MWTQAETEIAAKREQDTRQPQMKQGVARTLQPHKDDPAAMVCCSNIIHAKLTVHNRIFVYASWRCKYCNKERYQHVGKTSATETFADSARGEGI